MSMDFQPAVPSSKLGFFCQIECESESLESLENTLFPDKAEYLLKTGTKEYRLSETFKASFSFKEVKAYLGEGKFKKPDSPFDMVKELSSPKFNSPFSSNAASRSNLSNAPQQSFTAGSQQGHLRENQSFSKKEEASIEKGREPFRTELLRETSSRSDQKSESMRFSHLTKKWCAYETKEFWENRTHQKEQRERGFQQDQRKQQDPDEDDQKQKKRPLVEKVGKSTSFSNEKGRENEGHTFQKPILERPKTGIFALYYILTKIGIFSDGTSNFAYKKEIEAVEDEMTTAHKQRLAEIKKALDKERSSRRWGIAEKVFSWMASLFGIIAGVVLIATGAGAVAGAMMIVAGVIQVTNQILEMTNGWHKIAEILPGDDIEKKRAVVSWMQIGIAVLSLILAGVGIVWGGYANFGEALQLAQSAVGAVASVGHGVTAIGMGVSGYNYKDKIGEAKRHEKRILELKHLREDLMEKVDIGVDRLEQLFEDLSRALEFEVELFRADQMVIR